MKRVIVTPGITCHQTAPLRSLLQTRSLWLAACASLLVHGAGVAALSLYALTAPARDAACLVCDTRVFAQPDVFELSLIDQPSIQPTRSVDAARRSEKT